MILLKACPRCGGDINTTYADDIHCIQCSHRPGAAYLGPRLVQGAPGPAGLQVKGLDNRPLSHQKEARPAEEADVREGWSSTSSCPRCGSPEIIGLDKLRERDNTCYRCRQCGHIFSPAAGQEEGRQAATS